MLSGNAIQLYDCLDDPKRASYALAQNGVALLAMEQKGADPEGEGHLVFQGGVFVLPGEHDVPGEQADAETDGSGDHF